ncbi:hypothetical protein, partial [Streptomyces galilaeus]|uniref:hypothetical protein n=1 Tax=Streptomyces galilaeus TaxID=33899 RepID=UPI0038F6EDF0
HLYHRRFKLLDYFDYNKQQEAVPFITLSHWEPKLEAVSCPIQNLIKEDIAAFRQFKPRHSSRQNISQAERGALASLA